MDKSNCSLTGTLRIPHTLVSGNGRQILAIPRRRLQMLGATGIPWIDIIQFWAQAQQAQAEAAQAAAEQEAARRAAVQAAAEAAEEQRKADALAAVQREQDRQKAISDFRQTGPVKFTSLDGNFLQ